MIVAMVQIRNVRMGMLDRQMFVNVLMTSRLVAIVVVSVVMSVVMSVVVCMFVVVFDRVVLVFVSVPAAQNEADASCGNQQRHNLAPAHGVAKHRPGHDRADEWRCRKHELSPGCAQVTSAGNPQRD